jgi:hypothetical protein
MELVSSMKGKGINPRSSILTGKAGEYAVASQLLTRGMNLFLPCSDTGVDLMAENGCRVQVKSAHLRCSPSVIKHYTEGVYTFHFPKRKYLATSKGEVRERINRKFSDYCDVVVLWGIEQNRFWVVSADLLDGIQCIALGHNRKGGSSQTNLSALVKASENAWHTILDFSKTVVTFPEAGVYAIERQEK